MPIGSDDYYTIKICVIEEYMNKCICNDGFTREHGELICSKKYDGLSDYAMVSPPCPAGGININDIECPPDATDFEQCTYNMTSDPCERVILKCYCKFIHIIMYIMQNRYYNGVTDKSGLAK